MTVKELILELMECDMDATVDIDVNTDQEDINESLFDISSDRKYVTLIVEPKDYVLVDKKEFEEMQEQIEE